MPINDLPQEVLKLPEMYLPPMKLEKHLAYRADFTRFNEGQMSALAFAQAYLEGETNYLSIVITGHAGTGKTFWENELVQWMVAIKKWRVGASAPTNKAVQVISDGADYYHPRLQHRTCHSILGLREVLNENTGKQMFLPSFDEPAEIENLDVLVIDEASMFPDDLHEMIYEHVINGRLRLIYIGDAFQIPPVGKIDCIPFSNTGRTKYKIGITRLTEILRQAANNPIIRYANSIREGESDMYIAERIQSKGYLTELVDNSGIVDIKRDDRDAIYGICDLYFNSEMFRVNPDFMKVVTWHKKVVAAINFRIRQLIHKQENPGKIIIGEKMVAADTIIDPSSRSILYHISQEFEIISYTIEDGLVWNEGLQFYATYYRAYSKDRKSEKICIIDIIHEKSFSAYINMLNTLYQEAFDTREGWRWRIFWGLKRRFADVSYNYAITAHKAQGSTYDHCMVIDWDIRTNADRNGRIRKEGLRILYTSVTRPKNYLFLIR